MTWSTFHRDVHPPTFAHSPWWTLRIENHYESLVAHRKTKLDCTHSIKFVSFLNLTLSLLVGSRVSSNCNLSQQKGAAVHCGDYARAIWRNVVIWMHMRKLISILYSQQTLSCSCTHLCSNPRCTERSESNPPTGNHDWNVVFTK